jgi:hypothetical protein
MNMMVFTFTGPTERDTLKFHESKKGLYYYDATPKGYNINNKSTVTNYSLVMPVTKNLRLYTRQQRLKIAEAKRLYKVVACV